MNFNDEAQAGSEAGRQWAFAKYFDNAPIRAGSAIIFRDGDRRLNAVRLIGPDTIIYRTRYEPRMAGSVVVKPEWVAFFVPLGFAGRFLFSGCETRDNRMFLSSGPYGYTTIGERRDTVAIGIRRQRLLFELANRGISSELLTDAALDLDPADFKHLRELIDKTTDGAPAISGEIINISPKQGWEEHLLDRFLALVLPAIANESTMPLQTEYLAIVRAAEGAWQDSLLNNPSVEDMYKAAGVGRTQLWKAFKHIYGHSPAKFLTYLRLNRAHAALLDEQERPNSIKEVALLFGFSNSGRFARLYNDCFGEYPSATLLATRTEFVVNK